MGVKLLVVATVCCIATTARADVTAEVAGLVVDYSTLSLHVRGSGVPSLHAPTAQIGRAQAERRARADAAKRLRKALATAGDALGCEKPEGLRGIDRAVQEAKVLDASYGSDGSVTLVLDVPAVLLAGQAAMLGLAGGEREIVVDPKAVAHPKLFTGGRCDEMNLGPELFETVADARAALPSAKDARVVDAQGQGYVVAVVRRR